MRILLTALLALAGCSSAAEARPSQLEPSPIVPVPSSELLDAGDPEPVIDEAELSRTERTFEYDPAAPAAPVIVAAPEPPPYRRPRYITQCRRDNRRGDGPEAERMESKPEARTRARAMARAGELDEVLVFSRMVYGEEGTPGRGNSDGYAAILAVIDYQRGRMSRVEMMANYAPRRIFPQTGESNAATRQGWIAELQLSGVRPPSWPAHRGARWHSYPPWRSYGCPRWLAAIDEARPLLRRHPESIGRGPCEEIPHHWGGDMDDHSDDCHWRVIDCGNTADTFWVVDSVCREKGESDGDE